MSQYVNPRPQITDINGHPIVSAKKFFYEPSGGNILKTIYKDRDLTIPHTNPVLSDPNGRYEGIFLDGIYNEEQQDDVGITLWTESIGELSAALEWGDYDNTVNYSNVSIINFNGSYYKSRINNNINNTPSISSLAWNKIKLSEFWNFSFSYSIGDTVIASDGFNYISITNNNSGNDPISSAEWTIAVRKMLSAVDTDVSVNRIQVAFAIPFTSLKDGDEIIVTALDRNTSDVVIGVDSLPDKAVVKNGNYPLWQGDIFGKGHELILKYNLLNDSFELLNPSVDSTGRVVQTFVGNSSTRVSGSAVMNATAGIPNTSQGDEFMFVNFTPQYSNAVLHIKFNGNFVITGTPGVVTLGIFVDSITDSIGSSSNGFGDTVKFFRGQVEAYYTPSNAPATIRIAIRGGDPTASTLILNGDTTTTSLYGGTQIATITVTEIRP